MVRMVRVYLMPIINGNIFCIWCKDNLVSSTINLAKPRIRASSVVWGIRQIKNIFITTIRETINIT